ncbi:hypothetical protein ScPMuIL_008689 [Solemya velum]
MKDQLFFAIFVIALSLAHCHILRQVARDDSFPSASSIITDDTKSSHREGTEKKMDEVQSGNTPLGTEITDVSEEPEGNPSESKRSKNTSGNIQQLNTRHHLTKRLASSIHVFVLVNATTIIPDYIVWVAVPYSPDMQVYRAMQQAALLMHTAMNETYNPFNIRFNWDDDSNCYLLYGSGYINTNGLHRLTLRVVTSNGHMLYNQECMPWNLDLLPGYEAQLIYT